MSYVGEGGGGGGGEGVTIWQTGTHDLHQNQKSTELYFKIGQEIVILKNLCHVTRETLPTRR